MIEKVDHAKYLNWEEHSRALAIRLLKPISHVSLEIRNLIPDESKRIIYIATWGGGALTNQTKKQ